MLSSKNESPVQTINGLKERTSIDRVMAGEPFRIHNDRMGFTYRFEREDGGFFSFYINNLLAAVASRSSFMRLGFVIHVRMLGSLQTYSVMSEDITFCNRSGKEVTNA